MAKEIGLHKLATTLKEFRKDNNISQEDFAKTLEIARSTLSYYERAKSEPPIYTLLKMSEVMNCSIDELLGVTNSTKKLKVENISPNDLIEKIYYLNELISKNEHTYDDLLMSKKRTERMFDELQMSKKRTERMFTELNKVINRNKSDVETFKNLSKDFAELLKKQNYTEEYSNDLFPDLKEDSILKLTSKEKENFLSNNLKKLVDKFNYVPISVDGEVSCGSPSYAYAETSESIALPAHYKNCFALRVKGNSMNKLFKDGELIICSSKRLPNNGDIVIATLDDGIEATCKKFNKKDDVLELLPCSTEPYEIQYYDKTSDISIFGVVLGSLNDILDSENIDIEDLNNQL